MNLFIQSLLTGLRLGSVYALIALGYTMVYGIIRLINFAHGDFIMVGGYTLIFTIPLMTRLGLPAWSAVVIAIAMCAFVGVAVELVAYRPVRKKGTGMTALITAIAMSLVLENLAQAIPAIGPNPKVMGQIFGSGGITILGITVETTTILTIIISALVMIVLHIFVNKTKIGCAMRAVSEDKQAAIIAGVDVNKTIVITFAIGAGLAAVAALMFCAKYTSVETTMGSTLGLMAFVSAVLGGIGIIPGAMLGGMVIGLVKSFTTQYISSALADAFVFFILILILVMKPSGILGKNVGEKV